MTLIFVKLDMGGQSNIPRFNDAGRQYHGQPAEILPATYSKPKQPSFAILSNPKSSNTCWQLA